MTVILRSSQFFLTACHMAASSALSVLTVTGLKVVPKQPIYSKRQAYTIVVLAGIFCGSILAGNASLRYLPISFNQMVGATTPFFTALLAFLITGTVETAKVYLALVPVVVGVMISTGGEPQFHLLGLIVCLLSTAARALKSVMQGLLMSNPEEKLDSVNLLRFMAPAAFLMLIPLTLIFEDVERISAFFSPMIITSKIPLTMIKKSLQSSPSAHKTSPLFTSTALKYLCRKSSRSAGSRVLKNGIVSISMP